MSAGAVPSVPALPSALRPQESGQSHPCREAALILQSTLSGLQQEGTGPAQVSSGWGGGAPGGATSTNGFHCPVEELGAWVHTPFLLNHICSSAKPLTSEL